MDTRHKSITLEQVFINALRGLASRIYLESQKTCPVKTGELKASGYLTYGGGTDLIATIGYKAPYADMINRSQEASSGNIPGYEVARVMEVKKHKRTYPSGKTVTVRKHEKKVGPRPAGAGGGWLAKAASKHLSKFVAPEFPDREIVVKDIGF